MASRSTSIVLACGWSRDFALAPAVDRVNRAVDRSAAKTEEIKIGARRPARMRDETTSDPSSRRSNGRTSAPHNRKRLVVPGSISNADRCAVSVKCMDVAECGRTSVDDVTEMKYRVVEPRGRPRKSEYLPQPDYDLAQ